MERVDTSDGRYYRWEGERYWSATTILGALPKHWMGPWVKKMTATFAVEHLDVLNAMRMDGLPDDTIVSFLKEESDRSRDRAAYLGSLVHEAAEAYVLGQPYPTWTPEQAPFMENAFLPWLADWSPTFEAIEAPCFSRTHRYAGTLDAIIAIDVPGREEPLRLLIDYKTSKSGVFPETALQLAAYRWSETFIGLPDGDDEPLPPVDGGAVVLLRPNGYQFVPVRCDRQVFDVFLYLREVFRWTQETERTVLGQRAGTNALVCAREGCGHSALLHVKRGYMDSTNRYVACLQPECFCAGMRVRPIKVAGGEQGSDGASAMGEPSDGTDPAPPAAVPGSALGYPAVLIRSPWGILHAVDESREGFTACGVGYDAATWDTGTPIRVDRTCMRCFRGEDR